MSDTPLGRLRPEIVVEEFSKLEAEIARLREDVASRTSDKVLELLARNYALTAHAYRLRDHLSAIRRVVDEQAADAGLWFVADIVTESHLQAALRRLHGVIEAEK